MISVIYIIAIVIFTHCVIIVFMEKLSIIFLLCFMSLACEREVAEQVQELQKEEQGASVECLEKYQTLIAQLINVKKWTSVKYTAEECCLDPEKGNWVENKVRWQ